MEKKVIYVIIAVVAFILLLIGIKLSQTPSAEIQFFTEEPETWIEDNYLTEAKDYRISVMKATNGESTFSGNKQEYGDGGSIEAFFSHGYYRGNGFNIAYLKSEFYEKSLPDDQAHNYKLMEITTNLNPNDNVIQGFIMAKKDQRGFVFYIFVDEDWKNQLEFTNIVYGMDFDKESTLKSKTFNFNQIKQGIYMDKIDDYDTWYEEDPVTGGIAVGEINVEDLKLSQINSTFIMVR